jgi:hypothetical protein
MYNKKSDLEIVTRSYILAFMPLLSVTYTGMVTMHVAVSLVCPELLPCFMNKWHFPFLLYALRIFPDKKMESAVERQLSLGTFLWSYGRIFCHVENYV